MCVDTSVSEPELEAVPPPPAGSGVLAIVDSSPNGINAGWRAALVARDHGRPLHLVSIQPHAAGTRAAKPALWDLARQLKRRIQVRAKTTAVTGELRDRVVALAAGNELVVVPWQAAASWADKLLGTPAERMLRWLTVPVLIVRRTASFSYRRVLAPVKLDADAQSQISAARYMARGQRLRVLHVLEAGPEGSLRLADVSDQTVSIHRQLRLERAYTEMNAMLERAGAAGAAGFVAFGNVSRQVLDAARGHNAQLVVVGTGRRSVFSDVLCGGLVQDLIREAEADLLVLPS
jgi:nucleotide-binding universal stress UspA family protein